VKKAYDALEHEGFVNTVHGKGSFIAGTSPELLMEEHRKEVESDLEMAILKGRRCGMTDQEILDLFNLIMEE
ncbi:GntR family transcriptional regulator, partial [Eggerthella lenta]|nr:GntR family transcriptional regulator [Eggerthella lenta]